MIEKTQRIILLILDLLLIVALFNGCLLSEKKRAIEIIDGAQYSLYDSLGNPIRSSWQFPIENQNDKTKVKIRYKEGQTSTDITGYRFNEIREPVVLEEKGDLICKKNYLPNYKEADRIEKIVFAKAKERNEIDFFDKQATTIKSSDEVQELFLEWKKQAQSGQAIYSSEAPDEDYFEKENIYIALGFQDVLPVYILGYLNKTDSGNWGIYYYDNPSTELYILSPRGRTILLEAGVI